MFGADKRISDLLQSKATNFSTGSREGTMPDVANLTDVDEIGVAAGKVWGYLSDNGPASVTKLTKDVDVSRELAMQAIGWLAREDKIEFEQVARGRLVRLK